ncbi:MAG: hypothetical protein FWE90_13145 [Defluviitaleaceae bacterium]|nr:hypothetical protein [Defluviitaleaceae bacterium]
MKRIMKIIILSVLAALAVLTFVSRTVYNRNLPRVSIVRVTEDFVPLVLIVETPVTECGECGRVFETEWMEIEDEGELYPYVVPRDGIFYLGHGQYAVYAVGSRRGYFGPEDYVTVINIDILRLNEKSAAIKVSNASGGTELSGAFLARDISGRVNNGDTVWVRER